jgi:hypothetical protein
VTARHNFGRGPSNDYFIKVWFQLSNWVVLSRQDGHHSAVALLLKAALIQVRDYRLLGASGFLSCDVWSDFYTMYFIFKTTILEEDHPMTIPSKFGSNCATGSRQDGFYVNFP